MTLRLNARNLLALVILLLAGALAATVVHNFRWGGPEELVESLPRNVDLSLKQIHYTETRDGIRRWTLVADSAAHNIGQGIARIENIRMTFYDEKGVGEVTLTARSGEVNTDTHQIETRGDVVIETTHGISLYTQSLQYREADRLILTSDPVRLVSDRMEVTGKGLRFHIQNHNWQLLSDVRARIEENENG